ncbi:hypothetical protein V2G26_001455 [Clonostachys chloroleuca]
MEPARKIQEYNKTGWSIRRSSSIDLAHAENCHICIAFHGVNPINRQWIHDSWSTKPQDSIVGDEKISRRLFVTCSQASRSMLKMTVFIHLGLIFLVLNS